MSYHPSHRKPPRQERWPNATPQEGWPAYRDGDGDRDGDLTWGATGEFAGARNGHAAAGGYGQARDAYPWTRNGQAAAGGYGEPRDGYPWAGNGHAVTGGYGDPRRGYPGTGSGYGSTTGGYAGAHDGYPGGSGRYAGAADGFADGFNGTSDGFNGGADGFNGTPDGFNGGADGFNGTPDGFNGTPDGNPWDAYDGAADGFGSAADDHRWDAYDGTGGGYGDDRTGYDGYDTAQAGYDEAWDGYRGQDGYAGDRDVFPGPGGYLDPDGYTESGPSAGTTGQLFMPPDAIGEPWRRPGRGERPETGRGGLVVGAVTGFLAAAVAIGVATLAAAFVRPQASPVIAVGGAFIDRTPPALKNFAVEHFGENDKMVLLLGMYVTIALIAMVIGCLARRTVTIGVGGLAAFGLFGAFVAITRPEARVSDVIPSVIGAIAGIAALLWLARTSAPAASWRHAHGGGRRRA